MCLYSKNKTVTRFVFEIWVKNVLPIERINCYFKNIKHDHQSTMNYTKFWIIFVAYWLETIIFNRMFVKYLKQNKVGNVFINIIHPQIFR